jgi:hypothetical protein
MWPRMSMLCTYPGTGLFKSGETNFMQGFSGFVRILDNHLMKPLFPSGKDGVISKLRTDRRLIFYVCSFESAIWPGPSDGFNRKNRR